MASKEPDEVTAEVIPISGSRGPARGYSWEPFKPNHTKSLKYGARSERIVTPMAAEIANNLMEQHERLRRPVFRETVLAYARTGAQVELLETWIAEHGMLNDEGEPTGAAVFLLRVSKHHANLADRLGLSPLANAKLGKDTAAAQVDFAKLAAEIREAERDDSA